jgi:hypothetical protein
LSASPGCKSSRYPADIYKSKIDLWVSQYSERLSAEREVLVRPGGLAQTSGTGFEAKIVDIPSEEQSGWLELMESEFSTLPAHSEVITGCASEKSPTMADKIPEDHDIF